MEAHIILDGRFVSADHVRIAELIREYDRELELAWIPPDKREPGDKTFAIIHSPSNHPAYIILQCDESEVNHTLLGRIIAADNKYGNVLDAVEANNAALELLKLKEDIDAREERLDLLATIAASPLHTFKHGGKEWNNTPIRDQK